MFQFVTCLRSPHTVFVYVAVLMTLTCNLFFLFFISVESFGQNYPEVSHHVLILQQLNEELGIILVNIYLL